MKNLSGFIIFYKIKPSINQNGHLKINKHNNLKVINFIFLFKNLAVTHVLVLVGIT